jgi:HEAT repeat protein
MRLTQEEFEVKARHISQLRNRGTAEDIEQLIGYLYDESDRVKSFAAVRLGALAAPEAFEHFLQMCSSDRPEKVRGFGAVALGFYESERSRAALIELLDDPSPFVIANAVAGLHTVHEPDLVEKITGLLAHPDDGVKFVVFMSLIHSRKVDERLIEALERYAESDEGREHDACELNARRMKVEFLNIASDDDVQTTSEMLAEARALLVQPPAGQ